MLTAASEGPALTAGHDHSFGHAGPSCTWIVYVGAITYHAFACRSLVFLMTHGSGHATSEFAKFSA